MPLRSPASRDPSTGAGGTLGAGAGAGAEGLRQPCHLVLGLLALGAGSCQVPSQICSAGAAGRGAQGPAAHSGAAASNACHRCLEVRARPLVWLEPFHHPWPWAWPGPPPTQAQSTGAIRGPLLCPAGSLLGGRRGGQRDPAAPRHVSALPQSGKREACLPGLSFGPGHIEDGGGASWQHSPHTLHPSWGRPAPELRVHLPKASRHRSQHQRPTGPPPSLFAAKRRWS